MIRVCEIKINALEKTDALPARLEKRLHLCPGAVESFRISKESIDARQKPQIFKVYNLDVESSVGDAKLIEACKRSGVRYELLQDESFVIPKSKLSKRPVIVGFGPCGMFAALTLSRAGARPIVIERGPKIEDRVKAVEDFWKSGRLDPNANAQFGEGGAGTFSDGKLTTGTKSEFQRFVLECFVEHGANREILYKQKPHIGTDALRSIVASIRNEILSSGGEIYFNEKLEDVMIENGKLCAVLTDKRTIDTDRMLLCIGHSARDTVRMLNSRHVDMQQKQFSIGLRIQHDQDMIDLAQYGALSKDLGLGAADYKMNVKLPDGRGVYTFCMCPGGEVVNASSHEGCVVCNGMSYSKRDSGKANSAVLVDVKTDDFGSDDVLAGIAFQEKYESKAFELSSSYSLPSETWKAFRKSDSLLKNCLPDFAYESLVEAIPMMGKKLKGFDRDDALLFGLESRSSSPVRITRNEKGYAMIHDESIEGFYPCGEGAGYAGGIMSAACDGVRTAMKILGEE